MRQSLQGFLADCKSAGYIQDYEIFSDDEEFALFHVVKPEEQFWHLVKKLFTGKKHVVRHGNLYDVSWHKRTAMNDLLIEEESDNEDEVPNFLLG